MKNSKPKSKKQLSQILSSYYKEKPFCNIINEKKTLQKACEEMNEAKKSFHSVMQLQQELVRAYNELYSKHK